MIRDTEFMGRPGCLELSNGEASVIVSTGFGPRILSYSLDGGDNVLGWHPDAEVTTDLGKWKPYGGHRLWVAPENMPLSYAPDNEPVEVETLGDLSVRLAAAKDAAGAGKEITVTLDDTGSRIEIEHRITNHRETAEEMAAWALTIMRPGGEAIVPNEPRGEYNPDNLLPVRTIAVWPYTDFTDPRWQFMSDEIRLKVDENARSQQKFGVLNKQGWAGYRWQNLLFTKRFEFVEGATYPDMNSNVEVYTDGGFVEVETLSPLKRLVPGETIRHYESWEVELT